MTPSIPLANQFQAQGFVLVENLLTADECGALKTEAERVLREHAKNGRTVFVGAAAVSSLFYQFASDARLTEVLRQLLPEGVMFLSDKIVFKTSQYRFATPWHQDESYWKYTRPKISTWVALDDVTEQNGAMKVLPGSHARLWAHQDAGGAGTNGEFVNVISELEADVTGELVCAMKVGSVLFFSDRLVHSSYPNISGQERYALIGTYHSLAEDEPFDLQFSARHAL